MPPPGIVVPEAIEAVLPGTETTGRALAPDAFAADLASEIQRVAALRAKARVDWIEDSRNHRCREPGKQARDSPTTGRQDRGLDDP